MSSKQRIHVRSFLAVNASGRQFEIHQFQDMILTQTRGGTLRTPGVSDLQLDDGRFVNQISKGNYEIAESGEQLSSDDPDAP